MTLKRERTASGTVHTQWVDCPFCESGIDEQESFAQHYESCPKNPKVRQ